MEYVGGGPSNVEVGSTGVLRTILVFHWDDKRFNVALSFQTHFVNKRGEKKRKRKAADDAVRKRTRILSKLRDNRHSANKSAWGMDLASIHEDHEIPKHSDDDKCCKSCSQSWFWEKIFCYCVRPKKESLSNLGEIPKNSDGHE